MNITQMHRCSEDNYPNYPQESMSLHNAQSSIQAGDCDVAGTGGANKRGSAGELCGMSGGEHEGTDGEDCGARSSRVYCMEVAAADFRETDMRQHTLGSMCAPAFHVLHHLERCLGEFSLSCQSHGGRRDSAPGML